MRVVLDTGILIAALITKDTPPDRIYQAWRKRRFELVTSQWQVDEFRRVSRYPKLRKYLQPIEAGNLVNGLRHQAQFLEELPDVDLSEDPDDNPLLAMAIAGEVDYLVSGDKRDVLALKKVGKASIVTARRFLTMLQK
ncbi:MAG: putative toxin-antitoxin system toxin component, PIN family [Xanthomonadales bacterium]|jgi:putative PIN family toxin of toxin-antitoxin system|nr:putative toxin-antitoxin system toxin component, PIN family [Xanthomonadales bacterium]